MANLSGSRLGGYDVVALIGAGGMGEVYRAHDTTLAREVAIKVLPPLFTRDPERLARFRREAQVLAALNHPHIAQIYGLERSDGTEFLVLELVDGETLAGRIARGPLPLDEALSIAGQIGEALAAAHDKGIIHRDLKPANVALTADGQVKVLDFGLAKALESDPGTGAPDTSAAPTITSPAMTARGVILGTAAYMAPEQAKGRPADKRSDIWAFGCVLYELLTGTRAFGGEDVSDTLAAILRGEPDWSALPANTPAGVRLALTKCLARDRTMRLADISTALFILNELPAAMPGPAAGSASPLPGGRLVAIAALTAAIAAAATTAAAWWLWPVAPPAGQTLRFSVSLAKDEAFSNTGRKQVAVSRDGSRIAYVANFRLYTRGMSDETSRIAVNGSASDGITSPAFSPDGQTLVYFSFSGGLKRVSLDGGTPMTLCASCGNPFGVSWDGDHILVGEGSDGIIRIPAVGGAVEPIVKGRAGERTWGPQMLPDGDHVLFTVANDAGVNAWDRGQIVVQSVATGARTVLLTDGSDARYIPTGHLVYAGGSVIMGVKFDARRLAITGAPAPVLDGVRRSEVALTGAAQYAVSDTGTLAYLPGPASAGGLTDVTVVDRRGSVEPLTPALPAGSYEYPRVSPGGGWLAVGSDDGKNADIWVCDLTGTSAPRKLTYGGKNRAPVWSGDGERVIFQSDRDGGAGLFWQRADGTGAAERLTHADAGTTQIPQSASTDGNWLLITVDNGRAIDLYLLSFRDRSLTRFDASDPGTHRHASFSPDGTLVAYTGPGGVSVQPFPATGARNHVMPGIHPFWSHDGKELFAQPPGGFTKVTVLTTRPAFTFGPVTPVTRPWINLGPDFERPVDIMPDGKHFVAIMAPRANPWKEDEVDVIVNWFNELKARVK